MFSCCASEPSESIAAVQTVRTTTQPSAGGAEKAVEGPESDTFEVSLSIADGAKVGIHVSGAGPNLRVTGITPGGAVERWNEENPERRVRDGDIICEVNGVRGDASAAAGSRPCTPLLQAMKGAEKLELVLSRPSQGRAPGAARGGA
mmetsp:Transcript_7189/g.20407  ORF Transcript_7189/g.20407 Transcript_7189/m.20407 type:complete len:147 (-) Transcript_7189:31-471(-)